MKPYPVRMATTEEWPIIQRLREDGTRGRSVENVKLPFNVTWWVADRGTGIHACVGLVTCNYGDYVDDFDILITDIYDDGTREGKLALAALLRQALNLPQQITTIVPLDRTELLDHLVSGLYGGFQVTGTELSKPAAPLAERSMLA